MYMKTVETGMDIARQGFLVPNDVAITTRYWNVPALAIRGGIYTPVTRRNEHRVRMIYVLIRSSGQHEFLGY